jgi:hypothetical protein
MPNTDPSDAKLIAQAKAAASAKKAAQAADAARAAAAAKEAAASRAALTRLTSGATLTNAERTILGMGPVKTTVASPESLGLSDRANTERQAAEAAAKETAGQKTVINTIQNADGTVTVIYSDGTSAVIGTPTKQITTDDVTKAVADAIASLNATWQSKFDTMAATQKANQQSQVTTALEDFKANLKLAGLDTLADTIDGYIKQDMTASQIKINLVGTDAYKARFPGMADLAKAGRAVNEATYISMEKGMTSILKAYGLDDKILGTTEKLGTVIANQVSVAEYEQRVAIASDKVKKNSDVLASLNEFYGVDITGAISYLLDPKLGMDIVKKQIRAAEIGAAADMYKFDLDKAAAESYINVSGTADLNALKESFGRARILADTQSRLAAIEGDKSYSELQAVATTLGNDQQRMLESQRRALREQARFAGQSGISSASLKTESNI